jgi:hypothetical protein
MTAKGRVDELVRVASLIDGRKKAGCCVALKGDVSMASLIAKKG